MVPWLGFTMLVVWNCDDGQGVKALGAMLAALALATACDSSASSQPTTEPEPSQQQRVPPTAYTMPLGERVCAVLRSGAPGMRAVSEVEIVTRGVMQRTDSARHRQAIRVARYAVRVDCPEFRHLL
jgi:hypothetical protein